MAPHLPFTTAVGIGSVGWIADLRRYGGEGLGRADSGVRKTTNERPGLTYSPIQKRVIETELATRTSLLFRVIEACYNVSIACHVNLDQEPPTLG